jgi:hypothetical protein
LPRDLSAFEIEACFNFSDTEGVLSKIAPMRDSDRRDLLVRDADLAQVGECITDVEEVTERITLVEHVDRSR